MLLTWCRRNYFRLKRKKTHNSRKQNREPKPKKFTILHINQADEINYNDLTSERMMWAFGARTPYKHAIRQRWTVLKKRVKKRVSMMLSEALKVSMLLEAALISPKSVIISFDARFIPLTLWPMLTLKVQKMKRSNSSSKRFILGGIQFVTYFFVDERCERRHSKRFAKWILFT